MDVKRNSRIVRPLSFELAPIKFEKEYHCEEEPSSVGDYDGDVRMGERRVDDSTRERGAR